MTDLRGEASVALDALLQRAGHLVERRRERREVAIGWSDHASPEFTVGDRFGRGRGLGKRTQHPATGPDSEHGAEHRGDRGRTDEDVGQRMKRGFDIAERNGFVVLRAGGVGDLQGRAQDEGGLAIERSAHAARAA